MGNGNCENSLCVCHEGWYGDDCSLTLKIPDGINGGNNTNNNTNPNPGDDKSSSSGAGKYLAIILGAGLVMGAFVILRARERRRREEELMNPNDFEMMNYNRVDNR